MTDVTKIDLINALAPIHRYTSYLEICTLTTGLLYRNVDRARYTTCHRLMYACPPDFGDGSTIDFRSTTYDVTACIAQINAGANRYDAILVDPFHDYETSARDLSLALDLLKPGGTIIVHDCYPRDAAIVAPEFTVGPWCGVTYKAYLDLVLARDDLDYLTVDTDYGCGVLRRSSVRPNLDRHTITTMLGGEQRGRITARWQRLGNDWEAAFALLQTYPNELLKLTTAEAFLTTERAP